MPRRKLDGESAKRTNIEFIITLDQQRNLSRVSSDNHDTELARRSGGQKRDRPGTPSGRNGGGGRCGEKCGLPCIRGCRLDHWCELAGGRWIYCDVSFDDFDRLSDGRMEVKRMCRILNITLCSWKVSLEYSSKPALASILRMHKKKKSSRSMLSLSCRRVSHY